MKHIVERTVFPVYFLRFGPIVLPVSLANFVPGFVGQFRYRCIFPVLTNFVSSFKLVIDVCTRAIRSARPLDELAE